MTITNESAVEKGIAGLRQVDHVLISAGILRNGAIVKNDLANLRRIVEERLYGLTHVVRHAAPRMPKGSITSLLGVCRRPPAPARRC
jgi:NADP-dependent 3-hydroxy acid dehydrogenase YdfG